MLRVSDAFSFFIASRTICRSSSGVIHARVLGHAASCLRAVKYIELDSLS
jgi:hypothetical protein